MSAWGEKRGAVREGRREGRRANASLNGEPMVECLGRHSMSKHPGDITRIPQILFKIEKYI